MTPLEYFMHGSWAMYLIAIAGVLLYTLLIERVCTNMRLRKFCASEEQEAAQLHQQRSDYIIFIRSLIAVIPLLGLLGTVSGMMYSFAAMNHSGSDIGDGISQSLFTTQYALLLAAPALLIERFISGMIERGRMNDRIRTLEHAHA